MNETLCSPSRLLKTYEHLHWIREVPHKRIIELFTIHFNENPTHLTDILEREEIAGGKLKSQKREKV